MMEDFIVTVDDLHRARNEYSGAFCIPGLKTWANSNGLDFKKFVREGGIPASELLATGDALAIEMVEHLRKERTHEQG